MSGQASNLLYVAGQTSQRPPNLGWDEIAQSIRRRPRPTPLPLPQWIAAATIVEYDDPDEGVRGRARTKIREQAKP